MLSIESMRRYCLHKKSPGRHWQPGEANSIRQLRLRRWRCPGAAPCVSDLAEQIGITVTVSRGFSPHSAAGIKPGSRCPFFHFICIVAQNFPYFNKKIRCVEKNRRKAIRPPRFSASSVKASPRFITGKCVQKSFRSVRRAEDYRVRAKLFCAQVRRRELRKLQIGRAHV